LAIIPPMRIVTGKTAREMSPRELAAVRHR
jgi:hypothetical protein